MATNNPKIKYDIEADVKGEASVEALARTLEQLGDSLEGDLRESALQASQALTALGEKQQAVESFRTLSGEARTLSTSMDQAAAKVEDLGAQLPQAAAATKAFADAESTARTEADGLKALLDEQRNALRQLRQEYTGAARRTDEYRESEAQLKTTIKSLAADVQQKNVAVRTAASASSQAVREEKALNSEYQNAVKSARQVSVELGNKNRALGEARSVLDAAGIGTRNLAEAERNLDAAVGEVRKEILALAPAYREAQQASDASTAKQVQNQRTLREGMTSISTQLQRIQSLATAAIGGTYFGGLIKDVADTSDEFKNLEARVMLATGEGANFERSFEGVQRVALDTNSALDETGTLFARLTKASEEGGMAAEAAQQRALGLTETINQSIQLSGGSADSAKAAIVQLIQGLQSGVLRGEEFNSVMEQAPRLAQAMANGLGVTTGQLREMAKEGKLTAEVVMGALEGQADAVAGEFGKLPATVGRALQNLTTQWTLYVGASDKGLISSENAAKAINALAENLDTLVDTLTVAGKIWAAMKIAEMATHFATWATRTISATTAMEANTAAAVANTAAHRANALAVNAGAAAQSASATAAAANATALSRSAAFTTAANRATASLGTTAAGAASKVGLVGRAASALTGALGGPVGLIASTALLAPEIQRLGTFLGEGAAKLMGYTDRSDELAEADRKASMQAQESARQRAALAQETARLDEVQRGLTDGARTMIGEFDKARESGKNVADSLDEISKAANLVESQGIVDFSIALRDLERQGKISGDAVRAALADALKGEDLAAFDVRAKAAFAGVAGGAEMLETALDARLREAIRRSGAEFEVLAGGMSRASMSAINDADAIVAGMDRLKEQGLNVGKALESSLGQAIKTADSQAAVDALADRIESLQGVLGRRQANNLLTDLRQQAEDAGLAVDKLPERFKRVGAASDEARAKVVALREEYQKAVDAGDWQRASEIQEKLRDETGASAEKAKELAAALKELGVTSDAELKKAATAARNLYEQVRETGGSAREQADAFQKMADAAIRSGDSTAMAYAKSQAAAHGFEIAVDKAGKTVVRRMGEAAKATQDYSSSINKATQEVQEHIGWLDRMAERNAEVKSSMKMDGQGFAADESGNRIAMGGDLNTLTGIAAFLKSAGIDDDATARRIAMEFSDGKGNIPYFSNPGQKRYGGDTISMALLRAAERVTFGANPVGGANVPGVPTSVPKQGARDVNFNLRVNGKDIGTVPTDDSGVAVLIRGLEEAQRAAGM